MAKPTKNDFDESIKKKLIEKKENCFGIEITENDFGRNLPRWGWRTTYLNKQIEKKILQRIKPVVEKIKYKGSELNWKFYSVASSSRFAMSSFTKLDNNGQLNLLESIGTTKIRNVILEKDCSIINENPDATAHLDAYFVDDTNTEWFVEAKCHEVFDSHKSLYLKDVYHSKIKEIFPNINLSQKFIILNEEEKKEEISVDKYLAIEKGDSIRLLDSSDFGIYLKTYHFDFKQFLCHLMGIINTTDIKIPKKFYYLFYKNTEECFKYIYEELEEEIKSIVSSEIIKSVFSKYNIDFGFIYNDKFDSLKTLKSEVKTFFTEKSF